MNHNLLSSTLDHKSENHCVCSQFLNQSKSYLHNHTLWCHSNSVIDRGWWWSWRWSWWGCRWWWWWWRWWLWWWWWWWWWLVWTVFKSVQSSRPAVQTKPAMLFSVNNDEWWHNDYNNNDDYTITMMMRHIHCTHSLHDDHNVDDSVGADKSLNSPSHSSNTKRVTE